jgi:hypothetical protein
MLLIGQNVLTSDVSLDPVVSPTILYPAIPQITASIAFLDDTFKVRNFIQSLFK